MLRKLFLTFCAVYIFLFCWLGSFAYPQADDFNFKADVLNVNSIGKFFGVQKDLYFNLHGRVLNSFIMTSLGLLNYDLYYKFFAFGTILFYISALYYLSRNFKLTLIFSAVTLAFVPYLNESLYWMTGSAHFISASLILIIISLAYKAFNNNFIALIFCAILIFLNGTLLEQPCAFQILIFMFTLIYFVSIKNFRNATISIMFIIISFGAFSTVYFSPATSLRMGNIAKMNFISHLARALMVSAGFGFFTVIKFFVKPIIYALILFLPDVHKNIFETKLKFKHIIFIVALIAFSMQFITGWALGVGQPPRGESLALFFMFIAWNLLLIFFYDGKFIKSNKFYKFRYLYLILAFLISFNSHDVIKNLLEAPEYLAENIKRSELVEMQKAQGIKNIIVPILNLKPDMLYFWDITPYDGDYKNLSYSEVHGINKIYALPQVLYNNKSETQKFLNGDFTPFINIAEAGNIDAQILAGELYDSRGRVPGKNIISDDNLAIKYYLMAAENKNNFAYRRLISRYVIGSNNVKNLRGALYYFLLYELSSIKL